MTEKLVNFYENDEVVNRIFTTTKEAMAFYDERAMYNAQYNIDYWYCYCKNCNKTKPTAKGIKALMRLACKMAKKAFYNAFYEGNTPYDIVIDDMFVNLCEGLN